MSEFHYSGIYEVAEQIRSRDLSPVDLTQHILDRIEAVDDELKCFIAVI